MDITRKEAFILGYLHKQAGVKSLVKAGAKGSVKGAGNSVKDLLRKKLTSVQDPKAATQGPAKKVLKYVTNTAPDKKIHPVKAATRAAVIGPRILPNNKHDMAIRGALASANVYGASKAYDNYNDRMQQAMAALDNKIPTHAAPLFSKTRKELSSPAGALFTNDQNIRKAYTYAANMRNRAHGDPENADMGNVLGFLREVNTRKYPEGALSRNPLLKALGIFDTPISRAIKSQAFKADDYLKSYDTLLKKPLDPWIGSANTE